MSSPTKPYQSRLFNLLNRQSLKLRERLGISVRHLKVAVEWGAQILLYPIYLLVQTGRLVGHRLEQTVEKQQLSLAPSAPEAESATLPSDYPLEQVLKAIPPVLQGGNQETSPSPSPIPIQGVANLLATRDLVLVSNNNQILNILNLEQQKQLQQRILWEVANYLHEGHLLKDITQKFPKPVTNSQLENSNILAPIRWFWQGLRWMQRGPIAIKINLFGESSLVPQKREQEIENGAQETGNTIGGFGVNFQAKLREKIEGIRLRKKTQESLNSESGQDNFLRIQALILAAIDYFFTNSNRELVEKKFQGWIEKLQNQFNLPQKSSQSPVNSEPDPFQIRLIIQAAIDYFFNQNKSRLNTNNNSSSLPSSQTRNLSPLPDSPSLPESEGSEQDPWLSWDDLYTESNPIRTGNQPSEQTTIAQSAQLPAAEKTPINPVNFVLEKIEKNLKKTQKKQNLAVRNNYPKNSAKITELEASPDWLETQATPVGYVKHPLELILQWLDSIILWIEDLIVRIWHWLAR
jgi:hypothetical protein